MRGSSTVPSRRMVKLTTSWPCCLSFCACLGIAFVFLEPALQPVEIVIARPLDRAVADRAVTGAFGAGAMPAVPLGPLPAPGAPGAGGAAASCSGAGVKRRRDLGGRWSAAAWVCAGAAPARVRPAGSGAAAGGFRCRCQACPAVRRAAAARRSGLAPGLGRVAGKVPASPRCPSRPARCSPLASGRRLRCRPRRPPRPAPR